MKAVIKIVFFITCCLASSGVLAQTNTKVKGKLKGLEAGTIVYLIPSNSPLRKDSVIARKGKFEFNLALNEGDYYKLTIARHKSVPAARRSFYLQPGVVRLKGTTLQNAEFSGSKFAVEQNHLEKYIKNAEELKKIEKELADLREAVKTKDSIRIGALIKAKFLEQVSVKKELYRQWALDHPTSPVSAMVLWQHVNEKNMERLQKLLDHLQPEAKQNVLAKQMQQRIEIAKTTTVGKPAPDFVQNDTSGKPVALKDFRGKYVLIDFWASWCVPCRRENPNLVSAYNKLKDKNFTVLGISLDQANGKEKWLKAIQDDQLTWTHVSDLQYWNNAVAKLYGIRSVPSNLLIGPDGVILAKNLKGEYLDELISRYIK